MTMRRTWSRSLFAGAIAVTLAMAACGGDDDDASGSASTAGETAAAATSAPSAATSADQPAATTDASTAATSAGSGATGSTADDRPTDPDGVMRVASFQSLYWDPATQTTDTQSFLNMVYDFLVNTEPDGTLSPGLAESWEYSDDGMTLTFHLRRG